MRKPNLLLATLPILLLAVAPAARAEHKDTYQVEKKIRRLAHDVAHGAREVYRTASFRQGHHRGWGRHRGRAHYGPRHGYTVRLLADLEHRARDFDRALGHHPLAHTHREFEALSRAFRCAADAVYRAGAGPALARDFEHLAEHMYALDAYYREWAYPRRARYRPYGGRFDGRVEIYTPRWEIDWRRRGRGFDRDWDSDWDSDSDSDSY